jgi:hypothetical protein
MTQAERDWRVELIEAYPKLFMAPAAGPAAARGFPSCQEGWCDLLQRACARIHATVEAGGGTFTASQIKEKFGTLRFYWRGCVTNRAEVEEAIDLAEARSACTCEVCGEEGRLHRSGVTWMTRCSAHAQGSPVKTEPRLQNVVVVRRLVGARVHTSYRRYDRAADAFVEVDSAALGIEEE